MAKKNLFQKISIFWLVILLTIFTKVLEWIIGIQILTFGVRVSQLIFISTIAIILFQIFRLMDIKKERTYLLIPVIAYFLKEVYNLVFVFPNFPPSMIIALTVEPLFLWMLINLLNLLYLKR